MVELWALRDGLLLAKTFTITNLIVETWCLIYGAPPKRRKLITPLNLFSLIAGPFSITSPSGEFENKIQEVNWCVDMLL